MKNKTCTTVWLMCYFGYCLININLQRLRTSDVYIAFFCSTLGGRQQRSEFTYISYYPLIIKVVYNFVGAKILRYLNKSVTKITFQYLDFLSMINSFLNYTSIVNMILIFHVLYKLLNVGSGILNIHLYIFKIYLDIVAILISG